MNKLKEFILRNKSSILLVLIFTLHIFFRFYDLENRTVFGWDQVDNAWAAKDILIDHKFPLVGMVAKQNTGFYIGPAYYYFDAPFYWIFKMDPISAGVIAGVTSIFTFFTLFFITKKLFSTEVALIAIFLHTVSVHIIDYDRTQWPINFITPISLIIFLSLYKIIIGNYKYAILLAIALGFSLHLNFTSTFFPIIILLSLPFWPRTKEMLKYVLISTPLFFVWIIPSLVSELNRNASSSRNMLNYVSTYYHGFHVKRFFQLANDASIEMGELLMLNVLKYLKFLIYPIFCLVFIKKALIKGKFILCYLIGLWFLVPWVVFSLYSGEITDYYFSLTRPIAIVIIAYLIVEILKINNVIPKLALSAFLIYYSVININLFFVPKYHPLAYHRKKVLEKIKAGEKIEFQQGIPESYIYYIYTRKQ